MDGAAHQLRSTFYDSSASLNGRYEKFISSDKKKLKEAGKLYEVWMYIYIYIFICIYIYVYTCIYINIHI
jgi:hypothetical protein